MMRPFTCLSLLAALGAGLFLYQEKHKATVLDRTITATVKQADQVRDHIGMLKAELALQTDTGRLADLAAHHLPQLQPLMPAQYVRLDDLPARLPPISTVAAAPAAMDDAPAAAMAAPPPPAPPAAPPSLPPAIAAAPKPATVQMAARPAPKPHPESRPHESEIAAARPRQPDEAYMPPHPAYAPVMPAYSPAPLQVHAPTVQTASAMSPATPYAAAPFVGSALGMARTSLPAPVPMGAMTRPQ